MKELLLKYKEIIAYLFFGGLTTVVNIVVDFMGGGSGFCLCDKSNLGI